MPFKPFKILGSVGKGIIKGVGKAVRDILPVPNVKDTANQLKINRALEILRADGKSIREAVNEVMDILDDGKKNKSYDDAKAETITRLITGGLPVAAYVIHGILTGNWIIF